MKRVETGKKMIEVIAKIQNAEKFYIDKTERLSKATTLLG